jgi:HK97 family phage portal protein
MKLRQRFTNAFEAFRNRRAAIRPDDLRPVGGGLLNLGAAVGDFFRGAWQQVAGQPDAEDVTDALTVAVVYDCIRRISTDIAKMSPGVRRLEGNVWIRASHQALDRLIRKPNHFQTWFQFIVSWVCSRLVAGNAYILKLYSANVVAELIVLDPTKVTPMIAADTGAVFYRIAAESLARLDDDVIVAAADLIHDRYLPLGHPLIGTAPLERAIVSARARSGILSNAASLNENGSVPPGLLIAPEGQTEAQLNALADKWRKIPKGRIAVLDAAYKFEALAAKYVDSQSSELAEFSGTDICVAFSMPPWKLGIGTRPVGDPESLQIVYYTDCLQWQVEEIEQLLDQALEVEAGVYLELDPACLLRMDSKTRAEVDKLLVGSGIKAPNEARQGWDLGPVEGGATPYLQQQNYSLAALNKRDLAAPAPSSATSSSPGGGDVEAEPETDVEAARRVPTLPWAGVYDADREYPNGVFVTHKGSLWARMTENPLQGVEPGTEEGALRHWALVVKRGKAPTEATP